MRGGIIGKFGQRDITTHESSASEHGVYRGQQISRGTEFLNVTMGAHSKGLSHNIRRGLLAQKEKPCVGDDPPDPFSDLESMQRRQVNIKQN